MKKAAPDKSRSEQKSVEAKAQGEWEASTP
jgi:hypothetical protein